MFFVRFPPQWGIAPWFFSEIKEIETHIKAQAEQSEKSASPAQVDRFRQLAAEKLYDDAQDFLEQYGIDPDEVFKGLEIFQIDNAPTIDEVARRQFGQNRKAELQKWIDEQAISFDLERMKLRNKIIEILKADVGTVDITKSKILVSVGRGIGGPDKIQLIRDLADALGGEVSCSRPVADMGWLPVSRQVGISANNVAPNLYLACGISGASQHVTAIRDSHKIIAINKDPNAPIFRVADYGIAGDLFEVIPEIISLAKRIN